MNKSADEVINPDEHIVEVSVTRKGKLCTFYGIHDEYLNYWRSTELIDDDRAWTRDLFLRALFPSHEAAAKELRYIWRYRRKKAAA
jgi:hypothetical protein